MAQPSLSRGKRSGLAPVEFVLWLPILLFTAGLMVVFGTMAGWRVRGEVVARDAAWRVRWPRTGLTESPPNPKIWPAEAVMTVEHAGDIDSLNDPDIMHPVAVGPLPNGFEVRPKLHFKNGAYRGVAEIDQEYPLMSRLGTYESGRILHPMLDIMNVPAEKSDSPELTDYRNFQEWPNWGMVCSGNVFRRTLSLYRFPSTDQSLPGAFNNAVLNMLGAPNFEGLSPLDRDEDFMRYRGYWPDFYPYIPHPYQRFRSASRRVDLDLAITDRDQVYKDYVVPLIDGRNSKNQVVLGQISYLPRNLTAQFLALYEGRIKEIEELMKSWQAEKAQLRTVLNDPGSTQSQRQYARRRIAEIESLMLAAQQELAPLKVKVSQLEKYRDRLVSIEQRLARKALKYSEDSGIPLPLKD